ncbi:MAG: ABC transporter permease [Gordonia sp.]|nr:ABC transporter permease [Gordonia sp. (in: high G+C Gram-positive bacteria)]
MTITSQSESRTDMPAEPDVLEIVQTSAAARKTRRKSLGFIGAIALVLVYLGIASGSDQANLRFGGVGDVTITVDARTLCLLAALLAAVIGVVLYRLPIRDKGSPAQMIALSVSVLLFVLGLITWAARGESASLAGIAEICVSASIPLIFGATAGALCERAGAFNIAIEGEFLAAAFVAAMVGTIAGNPWVGLIGGVLAATGVGALLAVLTVRYQVSQVVAGIILMLLATGLTGFLTYQILDANPSRYNSSATMGKWEIPILSDIPIIGQAIFNQSPLFYIAVLTVVAVEFVLRRTRVGLRVRSVGENPKATMASGVNAKRARFWTVTIAGAIAGAGGAYFTVGSTGQFVAGISSGLGFVSLAAVILGGWRPAQAALSALLFGFATSLATTFGLLGVGVSSSLLLMVPYIITIVVVAGVVANGKAPAAGGATL